jgi:predicted nucleotidyltransferase
MPVRSLNSVVFRWPSRDEVLSAARRWAQGLRVRDSSVVHVLCFGSCARGNYGIGSDIDLIVVVREAPDSIVDRRRQYEPSGLPVDEDLWVYTTEEWNRLESTSPGFWKMLQREAISLLAAVPA